MAQTNTSQADRRSAERFLVSLPVETDRGRGVTRDVSVAGLYLVTDEALAVDDNLQLTLNVPDPDHPRAHPPLRVILRGRVVRVEGTEGGIGAGIALDEDSRYLTQAS
ncbi:MAG: PilZ domain-containing protein [Actinobacteria bacterium]|nr:PilZ domain-containing protein [Actinomycetota bacterium]